MLPRYISKQRIHCCLQEIVKLKALELQVLLSEQLLAFVRTEQCARPEFMHRTCFSLCSSHTCGSEKLFSTISMWNANTAKVFAVAGWKADKSISPRSNVKLH